MTTTTTKFNWEEFWRIAAAIFLLGMGVTAVAISEGRLIHLVIGFALAAVGVALLVSKN